MGLERTQQLRKDSINGQFGLHVSSIVQSAGLDNACVLVEKRPINFRKVPVWIFTRLHSLSS